MSGPTTRAFEDVARQLRSTIDELRAARARVARLEQLRQVLSEKARAANDRRHDAWQAYIAECEAENLDHHTFDQWVVHGEPDGPLGFTEPRYTAGSFVQALVDGGGTNLA